MEEMLKMMIGKDPENAMAEIAGALRKLFSILGEDARSKFLLDLVGETQGDKVSSMVHL